MSSIFGGPLVSFELMPPRQPGSAPKFWGTVKKLMDFRPDFVSVTYGAGGKNADTAHEVIAQLVRHTPVQPIAHFTCVGMSRAGVYEELTKYLRTGVRTFLALRGDPPVGIPNWAPAPDSLQSAVELVAAIREIEEKACTESPSAALRNAFRPLTIAVAAFPNGNPAAGTGVDDEVNRLLVKQAAGANFAITQLYWDPDVYVDFVARSRRAGVHIPIVPGILPPVESRRLHRTAELTGIVAPHGLLESMEEAERADEESGNTSTHAYDIGVAYAAWLARQALEAGAPGIHLYTFNRAEPSLDVLRRIGITHDERDEHELRPVPTAAAHSLSLQYQI
ncbi:methylenetetrahydrofolate reductase [Flaviflexus huanghaiensis]|uniref:methylenetetrahydrofolate reductase n=1 Tax=Flaviflexus huanghaiensis TaxID=1111473 RepID=UPI0015FBACFF|nr:methylenetetrahydrofolate reductase [Flaviflexus huanghaiensis]